MVLRQVFIIIIIPNSGNLLMREKISMKSRLLITISLFLFGLVSCVESEISLIPNLPDEQSDQEQDQQQEEVTQTASISGTAIDVFTGEPLRETWLCLADGTTCTQTDTDGNYTFNDVPYGEHTITPFEEDLTTVKKCPEGGANDCQSFTFTLDENTPTTGFQISTGDTMKLSGSITIITTWKDSSMNGRMDLDSHLLIPLNNNCSFTDESGLNRIFSYNGNEFTILDYISRLELIPDVLTNDNKYEFDSAPHATLDLDDQASSNAEFYMETMKIKTNGDGNPICGGGYKFYLNNNSVVDGQNVNFDEFGVSVRVLKNGEVIGEFEGDSSQSKYWSVFSINLDGSLGDIYENDVDDCTVLIPEIPAVSTCVRADQ